MTVLAFDLAESAQSSSISSDDVTVYVVPHSDMVSAYNPSTGEYDVSGLTPASYQECDIQTFNIDNTKTSLTCEMPIEPIVDDNTGATKAADSQRVGKFDYWIHVDGYNYNYVSQIDGGDREAFAYVGLQSTYYTTEENHYVQDMQEMSASICSNT